MRFISIILLLGVGALLSSGASAQSNDCDDAFGTAQAHYIDADYQGTVNVLVPCLREGGMEPTTEAFRLLALSYLKLEDLAAAKGALVELLSQNPTYAADPVDDLPSYRALVQLVRDQLRLGEPIEGLDSAATQDRPTGRQSPLAFRNLLLNATLGMSAYGGERGADADSWTADFGRNAGLRIGMGIEYGLSRIFMLGFGYTAAEYPHITDAKDFGDETEQLSGGSSKWVHFVSADLRARIRATDWFYPYIGAGVTTSYHYMNSRFTAGVGPAFGAGLDFYIDPTTILFLEMETELIFPGTALDLVDRSGSSDPLTTVSAGVRFRVAQFVQ